MSVPGRITPERNARPEPIVQRAAPLSGKIAALWLGLALVGLLIAAITLL